MPCLSVRDSYIQGNLLTGISKNKLITVSRKTMKKVYLFLAEGFEVLEAMAPVDILRRAGVEIKTISLTNSLEVTSSNGIAIKADATMADEDVLGGDALILPGGYPGYENLKNNEFVGRAAHLYYETGRLVCAICGAPIVLQHYGIGCGKKVTGHTCISQQMTSFEYTARPVEHDGCLLTAIGAGHAVDFGFAILEALCGPEAVAKVKPGMELA